MVADLRGGDRLPSVTDLEKHFGVAKSTVEAAVSDLQAEGLIIRRHGAGTFVAEGASNSARSPVGRLMITSIQLGQSLDIFAAMMAALESEMRRLGVDPILNFEMNAVLRLAGAQERWDSRSIDGYIHVGSLVDEITFPSVPGVVIGEVHDSASVHQVVVDNVDGGRRAGEHLWELGHRRVALITMLDLPPSLPRFKGLKDAVMERGGRPDDVLYVPVGGTTSGQGSYPSLEAALRQLLDDPEPPTALFFANDHIAFPGLQILQSWGVQIPRELSVVSFDDTPGLASQTRPALTSLRMPTLALGALAVQTLHQAITEPNLPFRRLRLPAELIVRESSGHAPGHSPVPRL
jgi:DNA-binding LacI/PurR family transcriptional regulator